MSLIFPAGLLVCLLASSWTHPTGSTLQAADPDIQRASTPDGVEYGLWGSDANKPAPTLIILAGTIDGTLEKPYFRQCGNQLAEHGFLCVSIDIPCHGVHSRTGRSGLAGWSQHAIHDEDFVAENNARGLCGKGGGMDIETVAAARLCQQRGE